MKRQAPMKITTALVLVNALLAVTLSSAGCVIICTTGHPVQARDQHRPQAALATSDAHDHAACHHEQVISGPKGSVVAANYQVSCNPDCTTWLKLSSRQNVPKAAFKDGGLGFPESATFEQSVIAASPPASASFSSAPPAKHSSFVLRV